MKKEKPNVYMVKYNDELIRALSQSGGVFTALTNVILEENGVIYGCVKDSDFSAFHMRADSAKQRDLMRGSKYIQSRIGDTYKSCKGDLEQGRPVLYSGTPCQIAGLQKYLDKEYENLICVDLICHGVPSPYVWKRYLYYWEDRKKSKVINVNFRNNRKFGWHSHVETVTFENGEEVDSQIFGSIYYGNCAMRPSCFECPYKTIRRPGNISIGDCWGVENIVPEYDDNKGISLVLINDEKGKRFYKKAESQLCTIPVDVEKVKQKDCMSPLSRPKDRPKFWRDLKNNKNFCYLEFRYGAWGIYHKAMNKIRKVFRVNEGE